MNDVLVTNAGGDEMITAQILEEKNVHMALVSCD